MTREEAKNIVKGITDKIEATTDIDDWAEFWGFTREDYEDFLEMSIKALEQEPCEDAVSRDAFITRYKEWMRSERGKIPNDDTLAIRVIKSLPSVTPTRKKGHWIGHREHCENLGVIPNGLGAYEWCSNCDYGIDVRDWHKIHHNYCPNCGAEMESGDKE